MSCQTCPVCGGVERNMQAVLWPELIAEWELSADEAGVIDRQQGCTCAACGSNLRSMALAQAIKTHLDITGPFAGGLAARSDIRMLEINEAGHLTPHLRQLPGYVYGAYPDVDMQAMRFEDESFDLIVHSDTLEHVHDPILGLRECLRVLSPGGACIYTVPIVVGRLNRRRDDLPLSFHGDPATISPDFRVWTEYGADAWTQPAQAGFRDVRLNFVDFPAAVAITARK